MSREERYGDAGAMERGQPEQARDQAATNARNEAYDRRGDYRVDDAYDVRRDRYDVADEREDRWDDASDIVDDRADMVDDWDDASYYEYGYYPSGTAYAAGVATGVAASSDYVTYPPCNTSVVINGVLYYDCGDTWYTEAFMGDEVVYVISDGPPQY